MSLADLRTPEKMSHYHTQKAAFTMAQLMADVGDTIQIEK
jgi:hypothetical protein